MKSLITLHTNIDCWVYWPWTLVLRYQVCKTILKRSLHRTACLAGLKSCTFKLFILWMWYRRRSKTGEIILESDVVQSPLTNTFTCQRHKEQTEFYAYSCFLHVYCTIPIVSLKVIYILHWFQYVATYRCILGSTSFARSEKQHLKWQYLTDANPSRCVPVKRAALVTDRNPVLPVQRWN